jgi:hypothetical protein
MPADVAIALLDEMNPSAAQERKNKVEVMADGTRHMSFGSIAELTAALKGSGFRSGFSGVRVGPDPGVSQ